MSEPFIGEIRMFGGDYAPRGWALCDGQLLPITSNEALFSLLGTIYGGDGRTTFGLPDLRGRVPVQQGTGPGLPSVAIGSRSGSETVALTPPELPSHSHTLAATTDPATENAPNENLLAKQARFGPALYAEPGSTVALGDTVGPTGDGEPHENMQPFAVVNFIIALVGIFPSRS